MLKIPRKKISLIFGMFFMSQICGAIAASTSDDGGGGFSWGSQGRGRERPTRQPRDEGKSRTGVDTMTDTFGYFSFEKKESQERVHLLPPTRAEIHAVFPTTMAPSLPLRTRPTQIKLLFPASDQRNLGTCASFSIVECLQVVHSCALSQADLITTAEKLDNCRNDGIPLGLGMAVAHTHGVARYEAWPYDVYQKAVIASTATVDTSTNLCIKPPAGIDKEIRYAFKTVESLFDTARTECIAGSPCAINKVRLICAAIDKYEAPVSISVPVRSSDWTTGNITTLSGKEDGWHAITVYGYDHIRRVFNFRNSWGPKWGYEGSGTITEAYVSQYMSEAWVGYGGKTILPKPATPATTARPASAAATATRAPLPAYESKASRTTAPTPAPRTVVRYGRDNLQDFLEHIHRGGNSDEIIAMGINQFVSESTIYRLRTNTHYAPDLDYPNVWQALKASFPKTYKRWRKEIIS